MTDPVLKLTVLGSGTSTGVPVLGCHCAVCTSTEPRNNRTRCSVLFEWSGYNILVDTATDFRQQALRECIEQVDSVLYTHAHADHLSGAPYIKLKTGAKVGIGEHIREVQKIFRPVFNATDLAGDGSEFDHLFADGETFKIGDLTVEVIATPGHTPACISYKIDDAVFVGDTLFMPDFGTARADFPGGDARQLYRSMHRLLRLPDETRLFMCHDYKAPGRDKYAWETTVEEEKRDNIHIGGGKSEDEYVAMREARDATLKAPTLLMPSIQVNMRAGKLPPAESNGVTYLKIPVKLSD